MFADTRISPAVEAMLRGIDVPPVPLEAILRRAAQPETVSRSLPRHLVAAAAVTVLLAAAVPAISPAFVQSIEARLQSLLPRHPPPHSITAVMQTHTGSLAMAQSRVHFTIVPPAGLPKDVTSATISTTPTAVYSKETRSWRVGPSDVQFTYRRSDGRSFFLIADRFDPKYCPPAKYIFDADGTAPDGHRITVKRKNFAWRNGDQVMGTNENEDISAREIESIRTAMHGIALPQRATLSPCKNQTTKQIRIVAP